MSRTGSGPLRVAFVGQSEYFASSALEQPAGGVEPRFFDFRFDAPAEPLLTALRDWAPDVVFMFRPEMLPAGAFADLDAVTIGYFTEPLHVPGHPPHPDLDTRFEVLQRADPASFDRFCIYNPAFVATAERAVPIWRAFPIPISDRYYAPVPPVHQGDPRLLFVGRSTDHRETFLGPLKRDFPLVHLAHGVTDEHYRTFVAQSDIGLNIHNEPYPNYEYRVSEFLAAGLLVMTEPLTPGHGLRAGAEVLEVRAPWEAWELVRAMRRAPEAFRPVRLGGRRAAERFRASVVYPRFLADLLADVGARGGRRGQPAPMVLG
jgi:hypothetical protein